jgi:hypothetical protein
MTEFQSFHKLPRLSRDCTITEKIDGTNAQIFIEELSSNEPTGVSLQALCPPGIWQVDNFLIRAGSRTRWITPEDDNFGFAKWVFEHKEELVRLGPGRHFGEWWGSGIQRKYGLPNGERRFSLFDAHRWVEVNSPAGEKQAQAPDCCRVVPILYRGLFSTEAVSNVMEFLILNGSAAAPGFMKPEGIVVYHEAARVSFKKTVEGDEKPKSLQNEKPTES